MTDTRKSAHMFVNHGGACVGQRCGHRCVLYRSGDMCRPIRTVVDCMRKMLMIGDWPSVMNIESSLRLHVAYEYLDWCDQ